MITRSADDWADTPHHALLTSSEEEPLMTPLPRYMLVCRDCDPDFPGCDLDRDETLHPDPVSTVHEFPTDHDRIAWMIEHLRDTGHQSFWSSTRLRTRADRARDALDHTPKGDQ